ncbi:MAG TPA: Lpp/OprI family alanine-zipper lipoprotein [Stellaceae bacterium]|nr:Lpp/OprI family alanine-zipper lipoprotein [Stellaceae bacterium]
MRTLRNVLIAALPIVMLGACSSFTDQDRATLASANENAQQAKEIAQQALTTAQAAQTSANSAEQSAQAANEKADRMFQRSLRKTSPVR